jgi:hypothetical protein
MKTDKMISEKNKEDMFKKHTAKNNMLRERVFKRNLAKMTEVRVSKKIISKNNTSKNNMFKISRKGIFFSASVAIFIVTLLLFSVTVYRKTEYGEFKLFSNSYALQVSNIEDSIHHSIKLMYETKQSLQSSFASVDIEGESYDVFSLNTTLLNQSSRNLELADGLLRMELAASQLFNWVSIDVSQLPANLTIYSPSKLGFYKSDSGGDFGESIVLLYNDSGANNIPIHAINISIFSLEDLANIGWDDAMGTPPGGDILLTININQVDDPVTYENTDNTSSFSFGVFSSGIYSLYVNNTNNSQQFFNITVDAEKISILNLGEEYNITIEAFSKISNSSMQFFIEQDIMNITLPGFELSKRSKIEFS